jgi:hypothetical protein
MCSKSNPIVVFALDLMSTFLSSLEWGQEWPRVKG